MPVCPHCEHSGRNALCRVSLFCAFSSTWCGRKAALSISTFSAGLRTSRLRWGSSGFVSASARPGQWSSDDRQGNRAVGDFRTGRLRTARRHSRRAGARNAGSITAALRAFDGSHGHRRAGGLVGAELERVLCAVVVGGSAGDRARAGIDMVLAPGTRDSLLLKPVRLSPSPEVS
jgi:hypothetical protein